jgi:uncharacterized DUF497 family protein
MIFETLIMKFEWDENKNGHNILQHDIDFNDAELVFNYPIINRLDDRKDYGEFRYIALGQLNGIIVVIVYTLRKDVVRIISMRKANIREREIYKKFITQ